MRDIQTICFRKIQKDDLELIMEWRLSEHIDRFMKTSPKLDIVKQSNWYHSNIKSGKEIRFMIMQDHKPIGNVYYNSIDRLKGELNGPGWFIAEKSKITFKDIINIYGTSLYYGFYVLNMNKLYGEVMRENNGVKKIIELFGLKLMREQSSIVEKNGITKVFDLYAITRSKFDDIQIDYEILKISTKRD